MKCCDLSHHFLILALALVRQKIQNNYEQMEEEKVRVRDAQTRRKQRIKMACPVWTTLPMILCIQAKLLVATQHQKVVEKGLLLYFCVM